MGNIPQQNKMEIFKFRNIQTIIIRNFELLKASVSPPPLLLGLLCNTLFLD